MELNTKNGSLQYLKNVILPVVAYSGLTGIIVGVVLSAFNYAASLLTGVSVNIYQYCLEHPIYIPLLFAGLILLAVIMSILLRVVPEVRGSGIPRTEGMLRGLMRFKWYRLIVGTLLGSFISFFAGLSLGSEGPCVQLGAATADGVTGTMNSKYAWRRYISTGGAAAGLAVAFKAPITGLIFVLEEVHKQFNPLLLLTGMTAVSTGIATSELLSRLWGGSTTFLSFAVGLVEVPTELSWALLIIGIIVGVVAVGFDWLILTFSKIKAVKNTPRVLKLIAVFILTGIAGLLLVDSVGSGMGIIKKLITLDFAWQMILLLLVVKLVLIVCAYESGATGGLFIPMLTLGALVGGLCGKLLIAIGVDGIYYNTVVLISMAAFMGAVTRAPITAMIMLVEVTGATTGFLTPGIEIFIAFIIAEVLMRRPLYDVLLERELRAFNKDKPISNKSVDVCVEPSSFVVGKTIREIMWPVNCVVHTVLRDGKEIVAEGKTRLEAQDILHIQSSRYDEISMKSEMDELVKNVENKSFWNVKTEKK